MNEHLEQYQGTNLHPVYFAINSKSRGSWGHQHKILHRIFNLQLEIIDFRSWHAPEYNHSHHQPLTKESFYVMDKTLALAPTKHLDFAEKEVLLNRVKLIRREFKAAMGESAVINIKRWLPGVAKEDELEPTDNYIQAMFGGEIQHTPKHQKSAEYCRQEAFKQAHSIMSVFERKATLEDLKQRSMRSLHGSTQSSHGKSDHAHTENENSLTFSDSDGDRDRHGGDTGHDNDNDDNNNKHDNKPSGLHHTQSHPLKLQKERDSLRNRRKHHARTGSGFQKTGAGGAGAVPFDDKTINIHSHFKEDSVGDHGNRDESHMSYIYGDEDSQHHKLPEYSIDGVPEYAMEMFQPRLPQLEEDQDDEDEAKDQMEQMERDMKMQQAMHSGLHGDNRGGSNVDDNHDHDNDNISEPDQHPQETVDANMELQEEEQQQQEHEENLSRKDSKINKLTIKIYPPAMNPVPSRSPTAPSSYMD